jgi:hypothetical protein
LEALGSAPFLLAALPLKFEGRRRPVRAVGILEE